MVMNQVRKAIESQYTGTCTVTESRYEKDENGIKRKVPHTALKDQSCRLSVETNNAASDGEVFNGLSQRIKLFISPDVRIMTGSKITVKQNGKIADYERSGEPAVYSSHQEIYLALYRDRA